MQGLTVASAAAVASISVLHPPLWIYRFLATLLKQLFAISAMIPIRFDPHLSSHTHSYPPVRNFSSKKLISSSTTEGTAIPIATIGGRNGYRRHFKPIQAVYSRSRASLGTPKPSLMERNEGNPSPYPVAVVASSGMLNKPMDVGLGGL
jgi:hypothetical protein